MMMDDLDALREAIHGFTAKGEPDERNVDLNCLLDAARQFLRLKEKAETVWWCLEHRSTGSGSVCCLYESEGVAVQSAMRSLGHPCRMVEADLIVRETP